MKKKFSSIILMLGLILSMLSVTAWGEETSPQVSVYIGSSSTAETKTLNEAIALTKESATTTVKIMLTSDVTLGQTLDLTGIKRSTTIDLNGYKLTANGCTALIIGDSAKAVTITGGQRRASKTAPPEIGQICVENASGNNYVAVDVAPNFTSTVKFNGYLKIIGCIKHAGTKTMTLQTGTYIGDILNAGTGTIEFKELTAGSLGAPEQTGTLSNTGTGQIQITTGVFTSDPSKYAVDTSFCVKDGSLWKVLKKTVQNAVTAGYYAGSTGYTNDTANYKGTYYETLAEAADKLTTVYLLKNDYKENFSFTFGASAENAQQRILNLQRNKFTGEVTDNKEWQEYEPASELDVRNKTTIDGGWAKAKKARGTAILTKITTKVVFAVQNYADVTVTTGSAKGIDVDATSTLTISGGIYTGTITVADGGKLTLTGGTYDEDVTQYCAEGYVANKGSDGKYTVDLEKPNKVINSVVETKTQQGDAVVNVGEGVASEDIATAKAVAKNVSANLKDAKATENITVGTDVKKNAVASLVADKQVKLDEDGNIVPYEEGNNVTVTIIKEPYLEVEVKSLTINTSTGENELKLDITPKYNLYATTDPEDESKTVTVSTGNLLTVSEDTLVTIQLPEGFASSGEKLLVKHDKHDGSVEYYTGSVSDNGQGTNYLSFTTSGFSTFTAIRDYAASIGEGDNMKVYPSLQAAVDAAKDGDVIKLMKDGETAVVRRTVFFTVDPSYKGADDSTGNYTYTITLGDNCTRKDTGNKNEWNITYTAPASETAKANTTKAAKAPATGDNSELGLFAVVGLISAVGVALLLRRKQSM